MHMLRLSFCFVFIVFISSSLDGLMWYLFSRVVTLALRESCVCLSASEHFSDATKGAMASQIASLTIVYSTVYSDAGQRKHQSSASLAFVRGIQRWPVNSLHKWPVTRKMRPFDDVIMGNPEWYRTDMGTADQYLSQQKHTTEHRPCVKLLYIIWL